MKGKGSVMQVLTTRFGTVEVEESAVIRFVGPIVGFDTYRDFVVVAVPETVPISWLQSTEDPALAFPVVDPFLIKTGYDITIPEPDAQELRLEDTGDAEIFTIVVIPPDVKEMRTNLRAPIVCNVKERIAKQVILNDGRAPVRFFFGRRQEAVPNEEVHHVSAHAQARPEHYDRA